MSIELDARIAAATALLTDFRREDDAYISDITGQAPVPSYSLLAGRLANALADLLAQLDADHALRPRVDGSIGQTGRLPDGTASVAAADVLTIHAALGTAADYLRGRVETCPDCDDNPDGIADCCGTCSWRIELAEEYEALAEKIRGGD